MTVSSLLMFVLEEIFLACKIFNGSYILKIYLYDEQTGVYLYLRIDK